MSYLDENGLVGGQIPAETECPFWGECGRRTDNCPSNENGNLRPHTFSCALARLFSIVKHTSKKSVLTKMADESRRE